MGLGPCGCTAANLEGTRKRADEVCELVAAGKDPIEERDKATRSARPRTNGRPSLRTPGGVRDGTMAVGTRR